MGSAEPFDLIVPVARQEDFELVFAGDGEVVIDDGPPPRPQREAFDVAVLGAVSRQAHHAQFRRSGISPDRETADLLRRRDVAVEQRRRKRAERDVVKPVARLVRREHLGDIDIEVQKVADGVAVFGPAEAPDGVGAARVGRCARAPVEVGGEFLDHRLEGGFVRAVFLFWGRHLAGVEPPDRLFPDRALLREGLVEDRFEVEFATPRVGVVAVEAVFADEFAHRIRHRG